MTQKEREQIRAVTEQLSDLVYYRNKNLTNKQINTIIEGLEKLEELTQIKKGGRKA